jgi:hypothetical protein
LALEVLLVRGLGKRAFHRSELLALVGTGALYAAIIVLAVPEYIHMAARLAGPYGQYMRNPYWIVLLDAGPALLLVAGVLPALRAQGAAPDLVRRMFSVAFAGYFLAAVLQHKGFSYHFIPAWGFAYLTLARVAQTLPPVLSWRPSGLTVRAGLILVAAVPAWRIVESSRWHAAGLESPGRPGYGLLLPMLRGLAERGPILVLSSSPAYAWPLVVDAGGSWPLRYMSLWPLPALYDPELTADMPRIVTTRDPGARVGYERRFNDEVLEDILREPPEVIVVQVVDSTIPAWATPQRIDYFGYFNADPRFASVFAQYREAARPRHFILLKRKHD